MVEAGDLQTVKDLPALLLGTWFDTKGDQEALRRLREIAAKEFSSEQMKEARRMS